MATIFRFGFLSFACLVLAAAGWHTVRGQGEPTAEARGELLRYRDEAGQKQPVRNGADWERRRKQILAGMEEVMGTLPPRREDAPLDVQVLEETKDQGFTRYSITFAADGANRTPAFLYVPTPNKDGKRRAGVVALHQTTPLGKKEVDGQGTPDQGYARELARRGYIVIAPDYPSFGDNACDFSDSRYASGTMRGIVSHMRCVDLLRARLDVDGERIGAIGHSLGGHNALFLAAFDPRVRAVVTSCGWTLFSDYYQGNLTGWTSPRYMPRIRERFHLDPKKMPFEFDGVIAAIAPRAVLSISPTRDDNFAVDGVRKGIASASRVYRLLQSESNLKARYPDNEHRFPEEERLAAYRFLGEHLQERPERGELGHELPRIPPTEAIDAVGKMKVAKGYRVELAAAEPEVASPVAAAWDERGRMYVVEMRGYSEHREEKLSRVRLLEDEDGDGRYEKATMFAEGLLWPTAVSPWAGGVFVADAPDIWYLKDTNGDGKADVNRRVFTGLGVGNVQGLANTFLWHWDNRIHGSASTNGGTLAAVEGAQKAAIELRGRDFSFDPRTLDFRAESGGGQHGMTFDDWGRKFVCANSDHVQQVLAEDRYLSRNRLLAAPGVRVSIAADGPQAEVFRASPVEPWRIVRTRLRVQGIAPGIVEGGGRAAGYFTGASGGTILRGDAWGEKDRGTYVVGDVGSNLVHRKRLRQEGLLSVAERIDANSEWIASSDIWFRPAQFANGPDGALYVLDVCREVIEHPQSLPPEIKRHLDLDSGRDRGRIFRVMPEGFARRPIPRLDRASAAELVPLLGHPNAWHRETAARLLYERQDPSVVPTLRAMAQSEQSGPLGRVQAMYTLFGLEALDEETLRLALAASHPRVREQAVRLAERAAIRSTELQSMLSAMTADDDLLVRYQLAFSLGYVPLEARAAATARLLARDGGNPWVRMACQSSLADGAGEVMNRLLEERTVWSGDARREVLAALAGQMLRQQDTDGLDRVLRQLETLPGLDDSAEDVLLALRLAGDGGDTKWTEPFSREGRDIVTRLTLQAVKKARHTVLAQSSTGEGAVHSKQPSARASVAARVRAVEVLRLGKWDEVGETLTRLLEPSHPQEIQIAALRSIEEFHAPAAAQTIVEALPNLGGLARRSAKEALLSHRAAAAALLGAIESGKLPAGELEPSQVERLRSYPDEGVRTWAGRVLARSETGSRLAVVDAYRDAWRSPGNSQRGRALFERHCSACHRAEMVGQEIGPNLAAAKNRGGEFLVLNILDPNREVNPQYVSYVLVTDEGRTASGILVGESAASVTLLRSDGRRETVLRSDIESLRGTGASLMPEGFEKELDAAAMADLVAYLLSLN